MNEFELLRELRALRRPAEPAVDLWPAIAARIPPSEARTRAPVRRPPWPEALAASMVLGLVSMLAPRTDVEAPAPPGRAAAFEGEMPLSVREARAMDRAYGGALAEVRRAAPDPRGAVVRADRELAAAQHALEQALARRPDAVHLLDLLRRTHEQRLRLAQRQAAIG
jgi:hypothetical protein